MLFIVFIFLLKYVYLTSFISAVNILFLFLTLAFFFIENTYTFAVRTINNAAESTRVGSPSDEVSCTLKAESKDLFHIVHENLKLQ